METYTLKKENVYQNLRQDILGGKYQPGFRLPKELDFAKELGVAKITLRSALEKLENDGLIKRVHGKGTFISKDNTSNKILIMITQKTAIQLTHNYILPGIEAAATEQGFETEICFLEHLRKLPLEDALNILKEKNLRGAILLSSICGQDDPEVMILQNLNIPVVIPNGDYNDRLTGFSLLHIAHRQAMRSSLEYLAGHGHRQVKVISRRPQNFRGWQRDELPALFRELGLDADSPILYHAEDFTKDEIRKALDAILADGQPPTAIQCYSDFYAIEVIDYLQEKGIRIPQDIAVMGYCGYPGGTFLKPSLSTIDFNYSGIGRAAVKMLLESRNWFNIQGIAVPVLALPYRLVERESTNVTRKENQIFSKYSNDKEAVWYAE